VVSLWFPPHHLHQQQISPLHHPPEKELVAFGISFMTTPVAFGKVSRNYNVFSSEQFKIFFHISGTNNLKNVKTISSTTESTDLFYRH
jgi:hypothetical protein